MILQVSFVNYVVNESRSVLHACSISSRVRTVESQMESEIREVLFDLQEIFQIEHFVQRTGMKQLEWRMRDTLALLWGALVLAGMIVLSRFGL